MHTYQSKNIEFNAYAHAPVNTLQQKRAAAQLFLFNPNLDQLTIALAMHR